MAAPILDGNLSDWTSADVIDRTGSTAGYDIYGRSDGGTFYFALKAPVAIGANTTAWFNTDQNTSTGFQIFGNTGGAEYNINFDASGVPRLYTGNAGQTLVPGATVNYAYSADHTVVEFSVSAASLGTPQIVGTLWDVNNTTFLPGDYASTQYTVVNGAAMPPRTDFAKKIGIVWSDTSADAFFSETAYSQLFMAAQNQAAMAGVHYDVLTEADLTNLSKLANYDALLFPGFRNVQASQAQAIENTLKLAVQHYKIGLIASGEFMTSSETGAALPGDPYARMKSLLDLNITASGFPNDVNVNAINTNPVMSDYSAGELIRHYDDVGWLAFSPFSGAGTTSVLATQTIGSQTFNSVTATSNGGGRNVHFSTNEVMADNNLLWQAIDYAVNGTGVTAGIQLSRQTSIVATRNDMDQAMEMMDVNPEDGSQGIYDKMLPVLQQWKSQYNFVGSYYVDIGNNPALDQGTDWSISGPYYAQLLAMGNELGSHSISHPEDTNVLTPAQIQSEFQGSRQIIEQQMSQILGQPFVAGGAAVPGASENVATALAIIQYYNYLSGGFSGVGSGYPGAFGYLNPAMATQDKVYLAPNLQFDFSLIEFRGMTPAQAMAEWAAEVADLSKHSDVPVLLWPIHDYGVATWPTNPPAASPYTVAMYTDFISRAYNAGAEFVTLLDLARRISSFNDTKVTTSVAGSIVTATVTSPDAGRFALDLDNIGAQKIARVTGWYAYDDDSVYLDRDGGTFTVTLGTAADDVTRITSLPMRSELVSLSGNGTNLNFVVNGEGRVLIDLTNPTGRAVQVTGATIVSLVGDKLTIDLGANGPHTVAVTLGSGAQFDFNADGRSDILWRNANGDVKIWEMQTGGLLSNSGPSIPVPLTWTVIDAHGDYNGDGRSDILWRRDVTGEVKIWEMQGAGGPSSSAPSIPVPLTSSVIDAHGDYNGDGRSDILWRNANGDVFVWEMQSASLRNVTASIPVPLSWSVINAHGDYNGDGRSDILWRNANGDVKIWEMQAGGMPSNNAPAIAVPLTWNVIDAQGDYNGDGRSDILWRRDGTGEVKIWEMQGAGGPSNNAPGIPVPLSSTVIDAHGDYNGDGRSDILWRNANGDVFIWEMQSASLRNVTAAIAVPLTWNVIDAHDDYNGDGRSDILWRRDGTGEVKIWEMQAGGQPSNNPPALPMPITWSIVDGAEKGATLRGGAAGDSLSGTVGRDTLIGLQGNDTLTGGAGGDRFVFDTALNASTNRDSVVDFKPGTDTLLLSDVIFTNLPQGTLSSASFRSGPGATALDANDYILYNTSSGVVSYDSDGSGAGAAIAFAILQGAPALTAQDVVVGIV